MHKADELQDFLKTYEQYAKNVLNPTDEELRSFLKSWQDMSHWGKYIALDRQPTPSPVQNIRTRIKRPESVVDKIIRKPGMFPNGLTLDSLKNMHDAIAGRVVVYFLANLPLIDSEIRKNDYLEVSQTNPPIAYFSSEVLGRLGLTDIAHEVKESGYASLHYVVRFRDSRVPLEMRPWFEIQVRTLTEHVWGEIEHILGYKPDKRTSFAVRRQFQIISSQLAAVDEHFNLLFEELTRFQREVSYNERDPLNAENLAAALEPYGIGCAQREIDGLLKLLTSRGINTVHDLQLVASNTAVETIRNTYRGHEKRVPDNFELIACLAAIRGINDADQMATAIKTQIDFLKTWIEIKQAHRQSS